MKIIVLILIICLFLSHEGEAEESSKAVFQLGSNIYTLNGQNNIMDTIAFMENGRTYLPVRYLAYACGLKDENIAWDNADESLTLSAEEETLYLKIGNKQLVRNNETIEMDAAPQIIGNRTYLPARWITEAFDYETEWYKAETSNLVLIYPSGDVKPVALGHSSIILVNKNHRLSPENTPESLISLKGFQFSSQIKESLEKLFTDAKQQGANLTIASGYRDYNKQVSLYKYRTKKYGLVHTRATVAPPGYSEHQTGLAVDINGNYQWLNNNCWKYGFILRYPKGKEYITGYPYEPWHFRYVGAPISTFMYYKNISTLEEFCNLI